MFYLHCLLRFRDVDMLDAIEVSIQVALLKLVISDILKKYFTSRSQPKQWKLLARQHRKTWKGF